MAWLGRGATRPETLRLNQLFASPWASGRVPKARVSHFPLLRTPPHWGLCPPQRKCGCQRANPLSMGASLCGTPGSRGTGHPGPRLGGEKRQPQPLGAPGLLISFRELSPPQLTGTARGWWSPVLLSAFLNPLTRVLKDGPIPTHPPPCQRH